MAAPSYKFHPLANRFPLMTGGQFADLIDDVRSRGLIEPITLYEGMILDGRNRYRACLKAGVTPRFKQFASGNPLTFVISMNLRRRHLSKDERKEIAAELLVDDPEQSDRHVAEASGISHPTVSKIRKTMERRGHVVKVTTRTDTKGRQQPAHKPSDSRFIAGGLSSRSAESCATLDLVLWSRRR
jgi:hypothetical protein